MYPLIRHGRKLIELQKCRNFVRFSVNPLQNSSAFSNSSLSSAYDTDSSSQDGRKGHAFTVSYLVDSLGLTKKLAESISKKVTFEEKRNPVKKKAEFLVNKMNWRLKELVSNSQVVGYSMERRIVPRYNVIEALLSRGLLGSKLPSMSSVLVVYRSKILKKFFMKIKRLRDFINDNLDFPIVKMNETFLQNTLHK